MALSVSRDSFESLDHFYENVPVQKEDDKRKEKPKNGFCKYFLALFLSTFVITLSPMIGFLTYQGVKNPDPVYVFADGQTSLPVLVSSTLKM